MASNTSSNGLPLIFSLTSTLAMAFSITNTWIGYSATFVSPLLAGGGPAVFWCLILSCVACTVIAMGLAELASSFPSSGGHYTFMVAPESYRRPAAFFVGWISVLGWLFTTASTAIFCAQTSLMIASFYHPNYNWTQWQVWLVYVLIIVISCLLIILLPQWVPAAEKLFLYSSLLGLLVAFITVLSTSSTKQRASVVFTEWSNSSGWPDGMAFLLATGQAMYGFLGLDGATHISEELPNPERTVPKVLVMIMAIGTFTSITWTIAFMFCTTDLAAVAESSLPIFEVLLQAIQSKAAATFFTVWICFIYYGALVSCFVTAGRLAWAFSRDNGLPYSKTFAKVHPILRAPANATVLSAAFLVVFGLLYVASTTAYNSIVGLAILASTVTCVIPQTIVLIRGRKVLPRRYFDLGGICGPVCNALATLYVLLYSVLFCFPLMRPVTVESMNYLSVVVVGSLGLITVLWLGGKRHTFIGPTAHSHVTVGVTEGETGEKETDRLDQMDNIAHTDTIYA